jgi:hypothetical protein
LDKRFTPHHLVLRDGIKLLKPTQGNNKGLLATYIKDFNCMLNVVPLKNEYAQKLIFLFYSGPKVQKIVYQWADMSKTCQGLMKMVKCMEDEVFTCPKGETESRVI